MKIDLTVTGLLAVLFAYAKLVGLITWSWWIVLLPIWILPAIFFLIVASVIFIKLIVIIYES